jgi:lipoprotein-releasing system permease protein
MPWYLYLALKQLFPTGRRLSFFTAISVVSVALGVALLIVVLSVMGGFGQQFGRVIVDSEGDVQVTGGFIDHPAEVLAQVEKVPGVVAATPFAQGVVMIECGAKPAFPEIQGIDLSRVEKVVPLKKFIRFGSLDDLDDDSVILGSQLAQSIGAHIGEKIEVYTPLLLEKLKNDEVILPRELKVVGIFEIGYQQLDKNLVIVTLRLMQELYGLGGAVHGINVRIAPGLDADQLATRINAALPSEASLRAHSWIEINQDFLWVLQLEKNLMLFIMLVVVIVAAFLTMSLLIVLVIKKTREIGLLGALGAGRREIALCFCFQGVAVGVAGTALGLVLGFTGLHFRNDAVELITRFTGSREILARFYQFSQLPAHTEPRDLIVIVISALVLSTLAGVIPAIMAARLKPVEALRNE